MSYLFYLIITLLLISTVVIIYNLLTAPKIHSNKIKIEKNPLISILIPARNEEKNIVDCIESILKQSYPNFEVIIGNDSSEDQTFKLASDLSQIYPNVKVINIDPKPKDWIGKTWTCYQLSKIANGEYFLFIDADVRLKKDSISNAYSLMFNNKLAMLSCFPTQITKSFGEKILVPMMNWLLLSFLPLKLVYKSKNKSFVAANGQFIMFKKDYYKLIDGHASVSNKFVEDMEFARKLKSLKMKIMTTLGGESVFCQMYSNLNEAIDGFSKNFYCGFNTNPLIFSIMLLILALIYLVPFVAVFNNSIYALAIILIFVDRILISVLSKENFLLNIILHPIQILLVIFLGFWSMYKTINGKLEWKGRKIN